MVIKRVSYKKVSVKNVDVGVSITSYDDDNNIMYTNNIPSISGRFMCSDTRNDFKRVYHINNKSISKFRNMVSSKLGIKLKYIKFDYREIQYDLDDDDVTMTLRIVDRINIQLPIEYYNRWISRYRDNIIDQILYKGGEG